MLRKTLISLLIVLSIGLYEFSNYTLESTIRSKVVQLKGESKGFCSGVQIKAPSGKDYILTAAHCSALSEKDNTILVRTDNSRYTPRRILEVSPATDLMLLEGISDLKGIKIASGYGIGQHLRSFTHGAALDTYKTEGELIQERVVDIMIDLINSEEDKAACSLPKYKIVKVNTFFGNIEACVLHLNMFVSTAKVVPGSSGGGIFDDHGKLVGIVSAGDGTFGIFVTLTDIKNFLATY